MTVNNKISLLSRGVVVSFLFFLTFLLNSCAKDNSDMNLILEYDPATHYYGYIDSLGNVVIPFQFTKANEFKGQYAEVLKDGKVGVIDKNGKFVVKDYDYISDLIDGYAVVGATSIRDNEEHGRALVNRNYEFVVPPSRYFSISIPHEGMCKAWVETDSWSGKGYYVFVDTLGVERFKYGNSDAGIDQDGFFSEGRLRVHNHSHYGFLDTNGKEVIKCEYLRARNFQEGYATVQVSGHKWGTIDRDGKIVIQPIYKELLPFSEGLAAATLGGGWDNPDMWGYLDYAGKSWALQPEYSTAKPFENGTAIVSRWNSMGWDYYGVIDKTGKVIIPLENYEVYRLSDKYFSVKKERYGDPVLYDSNGNVLFSNENEKILQFLSVDDNGYVYVLETGGRYNNHGVYNLSGEVIVPAEYYNIEPFVNGFSKVEADKSGYPPKFVDTNGKLWDCKRDAMGVAR